MRNSDSWQGKLLPRCGQRGYDVHDPRHIAVVTGVTHSTTVHVQFEESGWKAEIPLERFVRCGPS